MFKILTKLRILYKPQRNLLIFINYGIYHNGKTVKVNPIKQS